MADEQKPEQTEAAPKPASEQDAPKEALSMTNEELGAEGVSQTTDTASAEPAKKLNPLKKFFKRFNVYILLFALVLVVAGVVTAVSYLNSKKTPKQPNLGTQTLTQDDLKNLANSDATVGDTGQTLTVQGNAIFNGQVLVRSNLNVAGTIQLGGTFSVPDLTVSHTANLSDTQVNSLQVAQGTTFQGLATFQKGMNVAGDSEFTGPVNFGQITVNKIIMSGISQLEIPNHLAFTGAPPGRRIDAGVLGAGGTATINGNDNAGTININTGDNPVAGCFVTITFNRPFSSTPHVIISPVGSAAGLTQYYANRDTKTFSVCTNNAALPNQVFAFDYFITGS